MLQQERFQIILDDLARESAVTVRDLANKMSVSESTIRRDISALDDAGKVNKVFGGAVSAEQGTTRTIISKERSIAEKQVLNIEEKTSVAKYAAALVEDDDFVFIDAGTTTALLIENLTNKHATYITNGIRHALRLAERGFTVYMLSGQAKSLTEAITGALACESMKKYDFTKSFIGVNGIDPEKGFTTPDIEESLVKSEAVRRSMQAYILSDNSKFGVVSSVTFADIGKAAIITNACCDERVKKATQVIETKMC